MEKGVVARGFRQKFVLALLKTLGIFRLTDKWTYSYAARNHRSREPEIYSWERLSLATNRIFNLPDVELSDSAPKRINVLVPAFSVESISAGFFGVFNVALQLQRLGYRVRLVLFDNFVYSEEAFRKSLSGFPTFSELFDELEVEYIGNRLRPLEVSPADGVVATVWYSAYFAQKIQRLTGNKPFLYLIQDYESAFYPYSSMFSLADETYRMNFRPLYSTKPLHEYMKNRFPNLEITPSSYFNNACSSRLTDLETFVATKSKQTKKRFVFYSRPAVNRNMFELSCLAVIKAFQKGVFGSGDNWEFFGMGLGNVKISLNDIVEISQLPRMSLAEYQDFVPSIDVGLSLMGSPHPSIVPFDLAGSGSIVVTNSFENKTAEYFRSISSNIVVSDPKLDDLVEAIRQAVEKSDNFVSRHASAVNMNFPTDWNQVWSDNHNKFLVETLGDFN